MSYEVSFEELNFLAEMYELENLHYGIIKENIQREHMYRVTKDPEILVEGFSSMIDSMANFFKKMIEKIKEFFRKALMYFNSYIMELDKFCTKYKKELDAVKKVKFTIRGFKFTPRQEPNMQPFEKVVASYNDSLSNVTKLKESEIKVEQNEWMSTSNVDKLRGEISGIGKPISDDEFLEELRKYYRNGELDTEEIEVDMSMFRSVISSASEVTKGKKEAEKNRDELLRLLDSAEKFFSTKTATIYKDGTQNLKINRLSLKDEKLSKEEDEYVSYSSTVQSTTETLIKFKYNQTHTIATITNMVTTERVNAYKDLIKMNREIIQKALFDSNTETDIGSTKGD